MHEMRYLHLNKIMMFINTFSLIDNRMFERDIFSLKNIMLCFFILQIYLYFFPQCKISRSNQLVPSPFGEPLIF